VKHLPPGFGLYEIIIRQMLHPNGRLEQVMAEEIKELREMLE